MRASGYDGSLNLHAEYNVRYADGASWAVDQMGNLVETPPAVDLLEPDIAYLAELVAS